MTTRSARLLRLLLRTAFVFAFLLGPASIASAATASDFLAATLPKTGSEPNDLPYRYLVPAGYNQANAYPLIIFLHGSGERGNDNTAQISNNANGAQQSLAVNLSNNATSRNGASIDQAINAINTALQQSNNATLNQIVAVKDDVGGTQKVRFISTLNSFQVSIGTTAQGTGIGSQGTTATSAVAAGGSTAEITYISGATAAVNALAQAVTALGNAQAVIGRGENQFSYAINLAQSQLTNTTSAEATIRDADLATQSANLTKSQIQLQAGIAALAQANSAPQQILKLLQ